MFIPVHFKVDLSDQDNEELVESTSKIDQKNISLSAEEASYLDEDSSFTYSKFLMVANNLKKKDQQQINNNKDFSTLSLESN